MNNNPHSLKLKGFSNPGNFNPTSTETIHDVTILVEHDNENLANCVGLLMWQGNSPHPFEAQKFCRIAISGHSAIELGKKLQELGELVCSKNDFQDAVSTDG